MILIKYDQRNDWGPNHEYDGVLSLYRQFYERERILNRNAHGFWNVLSKKFDIVNDVLINTDYEMTIIVSSANISKHDDFIYV